MPTARIDAKNSSFTGHSHLVISGWATSEPLRGRFVWADQQQL